MYISDVQMQRVTGTGALSVGRARIRGFQVTTGGSAGRLTITDGSGGPVVLDLDFAPTSTTPMELPGGGILCADGPVVSTITDITAATIYYA
jgi:hypothetical protein